MEELLPTEFEKCEFSASELTDHVLSMETFLGLAEWNRDTDWWFGRIPIPKHANSFEDSVYASIEAIANVEECWFDLALPSIVRDEPVRFNNHVCVSYFECLRAACSDLWWGIQHFRKADIAKCLSSIRRIPPHGILDLSNPPDASTQAVYDFRDRVRLAVSEWEGIEHLRARKCRPIQALSTAALTEIYPHLSEIVHRDRFIPDDRRKNKTEPPSNDDAGINDRSQVTYSRMRRSPKQWRSVFGGISPATWTRWIRKGLLTPSPDSTSKAVRLPLEQLPPGYADH